ncbi:MULTISPECIES: ATP-binding protein [unclassified Paenibacillus]|uniref:AAA family ATPase n=1 Tax=Paenibacillus provencensis TaxID=441151 RepID=A0ABW3PLJ1_9BACL|nr:MULTISPECIES: ATP-binding protein [unclassified Paenibacillus]MCM3127012.1 ATP-binding protein [Paenibacillus sp. MER 78]SFS56696.1 ATPase family associated with various cellular activities (AAA) [Paenibacillus sp. 453mf]
MGQQKNKSKMLPKSKGIDAASVYTAAECRKKVKHIVLNETNSKIVDEFLHIQQLRDKFEAADVPMPNKMVMFGPPGTGKTLTAFYIAEQLDLPLIMVRLDAIIHSHLGETGSNLRKIFEYAKSLSCVLFLDEVDAIARARDSIDEVKEMARVVNTLLQCLDEFDGDSIFVAATNLQAELDHAIWRRFDTRMHYDLPEETECRSYLSKLLGNEPIESSMIKQAAQLLKGCSFADMEQVIIKAKRKVIIEECSMDYTKIKNAFHDYFPHTMVH